MNHVLGHVPYLGLQVTCQVTWVPTVTCSDGDYKVTCQFPRSRAVANVVRHSIPLLESLRLQRSNNGWFGRIRVSAMELSYEIDGFLHSRGGDPRVF
jgi:hypothetical protein